MLRWLFLVVGCTILLCGSIQSIDEPISDNELSSIGTGYEVLYDLSAQEKFAILQPPLHGIISYLILKNFCQFEEPSAIPSGNYFSMISFMFALESSKIIGDQILSNVSKEKFKVVRYVNLIWIAAILYIVSRKNLLIGSITAILLYPLADIIITATSQVLSTLLVLLMLELMISLMRHISYIKFTLLGIAIGFIISAYGTDGMLLTGIAIVSPIIWNDIKTKKLSKGFKKEWLIGSLSAAFIATVISWICYGMDLACFCQLQSLLGFEPTNSIKVVPFFDSMKQISFEIIFQVHNHKYSFTENISTFFNIYNVIITTMSLFLATKKFDDYGVFCLFLIFSILTYNSSDPVKINIFFETISVIISVTMALYFQNLMSNKTITDKC